MCKPPVSRRRFITAAGVGGAAVALHGATGDAVASGPVRQAGDHARGEEPEALPASAVGPQEPRRAAIVEARLAELAARFGDRWDEAQRDQVRRNIEWHFQVAERVRRTPLGNGDEPEIVFVPYRADAKIGSYAR